MIRTRVPLVSLLALALASAPAGLAQAQQTAGSGIAPSEVENSAERPIEFATSAPADAALVVVVQSATLPDAVPLNAAERAALERAIGAADFKGAAGETLSLRGIGERPRLLLVGVGETPAAVDFAEAAGKAAQDLKGEKAPVAIVGLPSAEAVADAALGYRLGQYRFDRYKTGVEQPPATEPVVLVHADARGAEAIYAARQAGVAEGVRF